MTSSLETNTTRSSNYIYFIILGFATFIIIISFLGVFLIKKESPLVHAKKNVEFLLYEPSNLPKDYTLDKNSVRVTNSIVFFELKTRYGKDTVWVSQQQKPNNMESFRIDGFTNSSSSIGSILIGKNGDQSSAIISTPTTLITLNGPNIEILSEISRNFKALD